MNILLRFLQQVNSSKDDGENSDDHNGDNDNSDENNTDDHNITEDRDVHVETNESDDNEEERVKDILASGKYLCPLKDCTFTSAKMKHIHKHWQEMHEHLRFPYLRNEIRRVSRDADSIGQSEVRAFAEMFCSTNPFHLEAGERF